MWLLLACSNPEEKPSVEPEKIEVVEVIEEEEIVEENALRLPVLSTLRFTQKEFKATDKPEVEVDGLDPEGGALRFDYEWSLNGRKLVSERSSSLKRTKLKRGDEVSVRVTARVGERATAKMATTVIANSPPMWESDPRLIREVDGFTVKAIDADGDPIAYRLEGQPKGMTISNKGVMSYKGSTSEPGGKYSISVIAEDPEKASVQWSFSISLSPGSDALK